MTGENKGGMKGEMKSQESPVFAGFRPVDGRDRAFSESAVENRPIRASLIPNQGKNSHQSRRGCLQD